MVSVTIRRARPSDRHAVYDVCLRTGDMGRDARGMYDDGSLLGHVYAGPYLALEPDLAFVLVEDGDPSGTPQGYCLGALDTAAFEERCEQAWWPDLRASYPRGVPRRESDQELVELIHRPQSTPAWIVQRHPSHLHIDLLDSLQGRGLGALAIRTQLAAMAERGSTGVHLGVSSANHRAIGFYERLGFSRVGAEPGSVLMARAL